MYFGRTRSWALTSISQYMYAHYFLASRSCCSQTELLQSVFQIAFPTIIVNEYCRVGYAPFIKLFGFRADEIQLQPLSSYLMLLGYIWAFSVFCCRYSFYLTTTYIQNSAVLAKPLHLVQRGGKATKVWFVYTVLLKSLPSLSNGQFRKVIFIIFFRNSEVNEMKIT